MSTDNADKFDRTETHIDIDGHRPVDQVISKLKTPLTWMVNVQLLQVISKFRKL